SRKASRIGSMPAESVAGSNDDRYPIRGTFFGCCASTEPQSAKRMAQRVRTVIFLFISTRHSLLGPLLLDYLVRSCQHVRRDRKADLLGSLQVNNKLKLHRQLDG